MDPPRKRWTREECVTLEASGLWDQQRLQLVHEELISKMGKKRPHVNALVAVQAWLARTFGEQFVNPEAPIDVAPEDNPTSEPEPDLVVLTWPSRNSGMLIHGRAIFGWWSRSPTRLLASTDHQG